MPWLVAVHCAAHHLALVCRDASEKTAYMKTFRDHLQHLHLYFCNSSNRTEVLKAAATTRGIANLKVKVRQTLIFTRRKDYRKLFHCTRYFIIFSLQ
jgi:hypothetical protein